MAHPASLFARTLIACLLAAPATAQTINTIAGNPARSNVPADDIAAIPFLSAVATDPGGTLYAATMLSVYRFSEGISGDTATLVAGTGIQGPTVPGAAATSTRFQQIGAIAVAANGDLFIADQAAALVFRRRASDGIVEIFAGGGTQQGVSGVPATNLSLPFPGALDIDASGRVYIQAGARVYRVVPATGIATHIAGNGSDTSSGDDGPAVLAGVLCSDFAFDAAQNLYCAEGARIRRITPAGIISTFAGTGTSTGAIDARQLARFGNLLFFSENFRVRSIDLTTATVAAFAGTGVDGFTGEGGPATSAQIGGPVGLAATPSGTVFIGDTRRRVRQVASGIITTVAFNGQQVSGVGGPALDAQIGFPDHVLFDASGNLYYATSNQIFRIATTGTGTLTHIAGNGANEGPFGIPGPATAARLTSIGGMALDGSNLYVSQDFSTHIIRRIDLNTGQIANFAGTGASGYVDGAAASAQFLFPSGLLVHGGFLYVADSGNRRIRRINLGTNQVSTFAGDGGAGHDDDGPATMISIGFPELLAADDSGNIYFADTSSLSPRVRRVFVDSNEIQSVAGTGASGVPVEDSQAKDQPLGRLSGLTISVPTGPSNALDVVLSDFVNHRVWTVRLVGSDQTGLIRTLAGNGVTVTATGSTFSDFSGDGGPSALAQLNAPFGLAFDAPTNQIVVADSGNGRIRRIQGLGNAPPTITLPDPPDVTAPEDTPVTLPVIVGDSSTPGAALLLTASSSNTNLVDQAGLVLGGAGTNRTLTITPRLNATGTSTITLTVIDGNGGVTRRTFTYTATPVNDPPVLNPIADVSASDAGPFTRSITFADPDGPVFQFSATSSNTTVLPNANLAFSGFSPRTLTMTPVSGVGGTTTVTVTLSDGQFSVSQAFQVTIFATPDAPVLVSAVLDGAVAELEWSSPPAGIAPGGYLIEAGQSNGTAPLTASTPASQRRFALLLPSTGDWFVRIRAVNGVALSAPTPETAMTVTGVSGRPRNLTAAVSGSQVTFRWTLPTNGARTAYRLEVGSGTGLANLQALTLAPTATSVTVNAAAGTTFVRLLAVNGAGASTPSNEVRLVVGGPPALPGAPADVRFGVDGVTAVFHWQAPATGGVPSQFVLDAGTEPGLFNLVTGIPFGPGFTFAASAPPGTYHVRLRAVNAAGSGPAAAEFPVTLPTSAVVPSAPALLRSNVAPNRLVTLAWTPPFLGAATSYLVEAGSATGLANLVVIPVGPTPELQVVAPPGTYFVRVRAVSSAGVSSASNEVVVVVP